MVPPNRMHLQVDIENRESYDPFRGFCRQVCKYVGDIICIAPLLDSLCDAVLAGRRAGRSQHPRVEFIDRGGELQCRLSIR
jgi:hypothetical protein